MNPPQVYMWMRKISWSMWLRGIKIVEKYPTELSRIFKSFKNYFFILGSASLLLGLLSSGNEWGLPLVVVCRFLIVLLLLRSTGSEPTGLSSGGTWLSGFGSWALGHRLSTCGPWTRLLHGMWDLASPGIKPMSLALVGGFFSTEPPGKPQT